MLSSNIFSNIQLNTVWDLFYTPVCINFFFYNFFFLHLFICLVVVLSSALNYVPFVHKKFNKQIDVLVYRGYIAFTISALLVICGRLFYRLNFFYNAIYLYTPSLEKTYLFKDTDICVAVSHATMLSEAILILLLIAGIVCLNLLADTEIDRFNVYISLFSLFFIIVNIMVYTTNILTMFVAFECTFVLTIFFAYRGGYSFKVDKSIWYLFAWTLSGALLVLSGVCYLGFTYESFDLRVLMNVKISKLEKHSLFFLFFVGFGVKLPLFPFYQWLTKIHVEAPAGFSIFLSGFLVKMALYCLFTLKPVIFTVEMGLFISLLLIISIAEVSLKFWSQVDIKKLIALTTVQEMNLLCLFLVNLSKATQVTILLFTLLHGILSILLFFIVEVIQRRTQTRIIDSLRGYLSTNIFLHVLIWFVILNFVGFPLTIKFFIEWHLIIHALLNWSILYVILVLVLFIGNVSFCKHFFFLLYGTANTDEKLLPVNCTRKEKSVIISLLLVMSILYFIYFIL